MKSAPHCRLHSWGLSLPFPLKFSGGGGEEHVGLDGFEELVESLQMGWDGGQRQGLNNRLVMKDLRFNQIINYEVVRGI